jgi:hypothetical protein
MTTVIAEPGSPIRRFSDQKIGEAIDQALKLVPTGKSGAVVAYADMQGARLAVMARMGDAWSVVGVLEKPWKGQLAASAAVRFAW